MGLIKNHKKALRTHILALLTAKHFFPASNNSSLRPAKVWEETPECVK